MKDASDAARDVASDAAKAGRDSYDRDTYDFVIAGGGSAGVALACRLSEDANRTVLLIEAGADTEQPGPADQLTNPMTFAQALTAWGLSAHLAHGRSLGYAQGKVVGGGSAINGALALRGLPADYDAWAAAGCHGWDWAGMLPYFRRLETDLDFAAADGDLHGSKGPVPIRRWPADDLIPLQRAFLGGAQEVGFEFTADHNDPASTGIGPFPMNRDGDLRLSTALTYLTQARSRSNLTVRSNTRLTRVLVDAGRAVAVEVKSDAGGSSLETVAARRIVLTAGALASPAILARSGIGSATELAALGIRCHVDNPAVGANLMDHPGTLIFLAPTDPALCDPTGPAYQLGIRWSSGFGGVNDMLTGLMNYWDVRYDAELAEAAGCDYVFALTVGVHEPLSRGRLTLAGADPDLPPVIDFNMLSAERDEQRLVAGLRMLHRLARSSGMQPVVRDIIGIGEDAFAAGGDDEPLRAYVRSTLGPWYHASGTCRMGPDPAAGAVVDPSLQVHGVSGLYVADASVMPVIPRAATNLTAIAIAEKAADLLREDAR